MYSGGDYFPRCHPPPRPPPQGGRERNRTAPLTCPFPSPPPASSPSAAHSSNTASPAIVMLHEGLGSAALWGDFPDKLAAATGTTVFAYSRAGYGASSPVALPRPLTYMHDE